jgi:hydrogenase nickel incorporation protein HypA/HybF
VHELSLAASLVEAVMDALKGREVKMVKEVEIELGALSFITEDQMRDVFEMAAAGTPVEGARLSIVKKEGRVRCQGCGYEGDPGSHDEVEDHHHVHLHCPKCNGPVVEILEGKDIILKNVRAEVD